MTQRFTTNTLMSIIFTCICTIGSSSLHAEETNKDMTTYQHILDNINESDLPDHIKNQLLSDITMDMISTIKESDIPEVQKQRLLQDLEMQTTVK